MAFSASPTKSRLSGPLLNCEIDLTDTEPDPAPTLDEAAAHAARLACLIEVVRSLLENLKAVASLYLEDMPIKEIALALGISESNASVRLYRAKSSIRLSFGESS